MGSVNLVPQSRRLFAALLGLLLASMGFQAYAIEPGRLWFYAPVNFLVEKEVDRLETLIQRAAKAGYNGAVITDHKFGNFEDRPKRFFEGMQRIRRAAAQADVELIPCVMPVGYSNPILQNDPNLAAGLPVKNCRFLVRNGEATAISENLIPSGDFEQAGKNAPEGWDWIDGWNVSSSLDSSDPKRGKSCLKLTNFREGQDAGNARLMKKVTVRPYHAYQFSFWSKASGLDADLVQFMPMGDGKRISYSEFVTPSDQPWTKHTILFNSFEHTELTLYLGVWSGNKGTLWLDDARLEVAAGVNLLRRDGCPIAVRSAASGKLYQEGKDFQRWEDPKLGRVPYIGEYDDDHEAPPLVLTKNSRIKENEPLWVSFHHAVLIHRGQVGCSLVAEKLYDLYQSQLNVIDQKWSPKTLFLQHDEIRVAGHDQFAKGRTSGELLRDNIRRCIDLVDKSSARKGTAPKNIVVWSDMFDPNHNAVDQYYLTAKTMKGSWEGLNPSVTVMNWNNNKSKEALEWFTGRSHSQIISAYYDGDVKSNFDRWCQAISDKDDIRGWMYTTWEKNYDDLETFATLVKQHEGR
ncbi:hypothetical protein Pla22_12980 [Rubripirellula amarantea]|uniref:CBM-cenC domain-containing protein n=1 Tax=Rubripirellula amarantea TaxID=2527999 RepID=A0A5C5WT21_9BACT|nr:hypothetical protein [Rubripirellula amarantea]TWT53668.1 hypothetical protein Pla22_12980 [Rubripirellula amarantea]